MLTPEDLYLRAVINRHRVPDHPSSAPHRIRRQLEPLLRSWAGEHLESVTLSGSYAKGTAIRGRSLYPTDVDVDLFLSLSPQTPIPLRDLHASLQSFLTRHSPLITRHCLQNVSLRIRFENTTVDLVPARRLASSPPRPVALSQYHTLWQLRRNTWLQTNIVEQIRYVRSSHCLDEILALKLWRRRHALRFPSFLLELAVIRALTPQPPRRPLASSFLEVLHFLATDFPTTRLLDPANSNNIVSDLLAPDEKFRIAHTAAASLDFPTWPEIL